MIFLTSILEKKKKKVSPGDHYTEKALAGWGGGLPRYLYILGVRAGAGPVKAEVENLEPHEIQKTHYVF